LWEVIPSIWICEASTKYHKCNNRPWFDSALEFKAFKAEVWEEEL
jgi:hypothetical protein